MSNYEIVQLYMVFGGVPYYWSFVKKGFSAIQNINYLFFKKDAILKDEFSYLYQSIFENYENV